MKKRCLLLSILIKFADVDKIITSLKDFNLKWLPLIFLLIILSVVVSAFKWGILLKAQNETISIRNLFGYYMSGLFFNNFLPSSIGGDVTTLYEHPVRNMLRDNGWYQTIGGGIDREPNTSQLYSTYHFKKTIY